MGPNASSNGANQSQFDNMYVYGLSVKHRVSFISELRHLFWAGYANNVKLVDFSPVLALQNIA